MSVGSVYVSKKYRLVKKIGSGAFGQVFQGVDIETGEAVAIKLEDRKTLYPQLCHENRIYKAAGNYPGIPKVKWFGQEGDYTILVMELLGDNLESLFNCCGRQFSLKTVLTLADKMIKRLENLHGCNYIHRDLKPENFVMGCGINSKQLYLIDFGLGKKYRDVGGSRTHILNRGGKSLTGTARYASTNAHQGNEQSRRDDLESLGYLLLYFCLGQLPWQNLRGRSKTAKYAAIGEKKLAISVTELCAGLPPQFASYMRYVRALTFEQTPDYRYLRNLFRSLYFSEFEAYDGIYDWTPLEPESEYDEEQEERQKVVAKVECQAIQQYQSPWSPNRQIFSGGGGCGGPSGGNVSPFGTPVRTSAKLSPFAPRFNPRGGGGGVGVAGGGGGGGSTSINTTHPYSLRRRTAADLFLAPTRAAVEGISGATIAAGGTGRAELLRNTGGHQRNLLETWYAH